MKLKVKPRRHLDNDPDMNPDYFESDRDYLENNRDLAVQMLDELPNGIPDWSACCRASHRLAELVILMYHGKDPHLDLVRKTWPTATWAEIIASELGIEVPETEDL